MSKGYIYVASNPAFRENIYKIGRTDRTPHERMDELYTTGVPEPFKLLGWVQVSDSRAVERELHIRYDRYRIRQNREFFKLTEQQAREVLDSIKGTSGVLIVAGGVGGFFYRLVRNVSLILIDTLWNTLFSRRSFSTVLRSSIKRRVFKRSRWL